MAGALQSTSHPVRNLLATAIVWLAAASNGYALCSQSLAEPDGLQSSGSIYRVYMPEQSCWNGSLVVYAHGYVPFNAPLAIPEDQLVTPDGASLPQIVNALGFAFAVNSYSRNGLAILEGLADIVDLVEIFKATHPGTGAVYINGVSEGGLIAALALERQPGVFSGGVAACAPIGDFRGQVNHAGDFRVLFDYFFPHAFPGDVTQTPAFVIDSWDSFYEPFFRDLAAIFPGKTDQLLKASKVPLAADSAARIDTVAQLLKYSAFGVNDAAQQLGGQPFSNAQRLYTGSNHDGLLNLLVGRYSADQAAVDAMAEYQTNGALQKPLVALHTTRDPLVPFWHEKIYRLKTIAAGAASKQIVLPIDRYGHCEFTAAEVIAAFYLQILLAGGPDLAADIQRVLPVSQLQFFRNALRTAASAPVEPDADSSPK